MRYRLRTLLLVTTVIAAVLGLLFGGENWMQPVLFVLLAFCAIVACTATIFGYRAAGDIIVAGLVVLAFFFSVMFRMAFSTT